MRGKNNDSCVLFYKDVGDFCILKDGISETRRCFAWGFPGWMIMTQGRLVQAFYFLNTKNFSAEITYFSHEHDPNNWGPTAQCGSHADHMLDLFLSRGSGELIRSWVLSSTENFLIALECFISAPCGREERSIGLAHWINPIGFRANAGKLPSISA